MFLRLIILILVINHSQAKSEHFTVPLTQHQRILDEGARHLTVSDILIFIKSLFNIILP